jgi:hypothetical protein
MLQEHRNPENKAKKYMTIWFLIKTITSVLNDISNDQNVHLDECKTQVVNMRPPTEDKKKEEAQPNI